MSDTVKRPDLRELFAEEAHKAWSGWMEYLFSKSEANDPGEVIIPAWAAERWRRQAVTPYSELPEDEKKSDREEADRYLQHLPDYDRDIKALEARCANFEAEQAEDAGRIEQLRKRNAELFNHRAEQVKTIAALTEAVNGGVEKVTEQAKTIARLQGIIETLQGCIPDGVGQEVIDHIAALKEARDHDR